MQFLCAYMRYLCIVSNYVFMKEYNLEELHKLKGLTQKQLANALAMDQTTYSRKEHGKSKITDDEWDRICKVLDISRDDVVYLNIKDNKPKSKSLEISTPTNEDTLIISRQLYETLIKYNAVLEKEVFRLKEELNKLSL